MMIVCKMYQNIMQYNYNQQYDYLFPCCEMKTTLTPFQKFLEKQKNRKYNHERKSFEFVIENMNKKRESRKSSTPRTHIQIKEIIRMNTNRSEKKRNPEYKLKDLSQQLKIKNFISKQLIINEHPLHSNNFITKRNNYTIKTQRISGLSKDLKEISYTNKQIDIFPSSRNKSQCLKRVTGIKSPLNKFKTQIEKTKQLDVRNSNHELINSSSKLLENYSTESKKNNIQAHDVDEQYQVLLKFYQKKYQKKQKTDLNLLKFSTKFKISNRKTMFKNHPQPWDTPQFRFW